jgi:hypothetical protein
MESVAAAVDSSLSNEPVTSSRRWRRIGAHY